MAARWRPTAQPGRAWTGLGEVEFHEFTPPDEVPDRARGAAILVTNKAPIRAPLIESSAELRFITVTATGFDCVDVAAARQKGIPVSNVPEYSTHSVAQFVFALLLELCEHVGKHAAAVTAGRVDEPARFLAAEDAALRAGRQDDGDRRLRPDRPGRSAEIARAFGMTVVASRSSRSAASTRCSRSSAAISMNSSPARTSSACTVRSRRKPPGW